MKEWIKNFSEIEKMFKEICILLEEETFNKTKFVECFALTALRMCKSNAGSVKLLLENEFYVELLIVLRYQLELLFRLKWINEPESIEDKNIRTNEIEAEVYSKMQCGINDLKCRKLEFFNKDLIKDAQESIDCLKKQKPYLINKNDNFLKDPGNFSMAGNYTEIFYTHYRFLSIFAHPNPTLNDYFQSSIECCESIDLKTLTECLKYSVKVYKHIIDITLNILHPNLENIDEIKDIQKEFNDFAGK